MPSLITILRDVADPRTGNPTRHEPLDVLVIATASICGSESCVEFADFAEDREELFREFLSLPNGLPSHDTFSRLLRLFDPAVSSECFSRFLDDLGGDGPGVIAIDGKTLRRSFDRVVATVERDGKASTSTRSYLSSARLSAQAFAKVVRGHWAIENGLHRVLDTTFRADDARARKDHGPENLAIIRKLALDILKTARPKISIRPKRK